jgi:hypothetical protein
VFKGALDAHQCSSNCRAIARKATKIADHGAFSSPPSAKAMPQTAAQVLFERHISPPVRVAIDIDSVPKFSMSGLRYK